MFIKTQRLWLRMAVCTLTACLPALSKAQEGNAFAWVDTCNDVLGYSGCANMMHPQTPGGGQVTKPAIDPCYLAQNAMIPCAKERQASKPAGVDPHLVGTWVLPVHGGNWVLEVFRDGSYKFHSEAADGAAPNSGTFSAANGHWALKATNGYADGGSYVFQVPDTWIATGQLGTAAWRQRAPAPSRAAAGVTTAGGPTDSVRR
jgi:hypothetical protein